MCYTLRSCRQSFLRVTPDRKPALGEPVSLPEDQKRVLLAPPLLVKYCSIRSSLFLHAGILTRPFHASRPSFSLKMCIVMCPCFSPAHWNRLGSYSSDYSGHCHPFHQFFSYPPHDLPQGHIPGLKPTWDTQTHKHTNTQTHKHTNTQTHKHTNIQTHKHTNTQTHKHTNTKTHKHKNTQTHKHTNTQTHKHTHTNTQTHKHTNTQTHKHTNTRQHKHTPTHTQRHKD